MGAFAAADGDPALGATRYAERCASCHDHRVISFARARVTGSDVTTGV